MSDLWQLSLKLCHISVQSSPPFIRCCWLLKNVIYNFKLNKLKIDLFFFNLTLLLIYLACSGLSARQRNYLKNKIKFYIQGRDQIKKWV